ncbi:MAG: hypothetical protein JSR82_18525 [Verrucomicrobia bacterium]|nr:hypothetical protein [Verrucomicrobiota bacterium]
MSSLKKDRADYWAGRAPGYGPEVPTTTDTAKPQGWFIRLRNRYPSIVYLFTPRIWNDPDHFLPTDVEQEIYFRRRKIKIVLVLLLLVAGAIFLPDRIRSTMEVYRARERAKEALTLLEKGEAAAAWDKAQVAKTIRPREPVVLRALALSAGKAGRPEEAVEAWRTYASVKGEFTPQDRLERAEALAATGRYSAARTILKEVPAGAADGPGESLLSARLNLGLGDKDEAARLLGEMLARPQLPFGVRLEAIRVALESLPPEAPARTAAQTALARFVAEPLEAHAPAVEYAAKRLALGELSPEAISPETVRARLNALPLNLERRLLAFDLEIQAQPGRLADCVQDAQVVYNRQPTRESLALLANWLLKHREWARVLTLLPPVRAKESTALALARLNALSGSGQLREAKLEITSQRYQLDPLTQQVLLAQIVGAAGDKAAADSRWNSAINLAGDDRAKLRQVESAALAAGSEVTAKRAASLASASEAALMLAQP